MERISMRGVSCGYYTSSMSFQFEKSTQIEVVSLRLSVPWFIV